MDISRTGVALVTPFQSDNQIDALSLKKLVDHVIEGGVEFLVALGTTSESATLSTPEKHKVAAMIAEQNNGRLPIMLGIGGNNTAEVIDAITRFPNISDYQAILSVVPYYNKPSQEGLCQHFKTIAENAPLPIFLYNVPGRTAVNMTAETIVRLSHECKNIIGIKEAGCDFLQITDTLRDMREEFIFLSGNDELTLPELSLGAKGVISVTANLFPAAYSSMVRFACNGEYEAARKIHMQLAVYFRLLFKEGNPSGVKAALHIARIIQENQLRLPLTPVSKELYRTLEETVING
jgi:4-hydroxy-tetrahydrodipicolinate synthase